MLKTFKTLKSPHLFGQYQYGLQHISPTGQFAQNIYLIAYRIGLYYQQQDRSGQVPKFRTQGILIVTTEISDRVLKVHT